MPAKSVRSVSLTPELTALIDGKIASDHCRSASEVVRASLLLAGQGQETDGNPQMRETGGHDAC